MYQNQEPNDDEVVVVDPLDSEEVQKALKTTSEQKRHWREKAIDAKSGKTWKELYEEAQKKEEPPKLEKEETQITKETKPPVDHDWIFDNIDVLTPLTQEERTELRQTARELNVEPVKFIKSKAGQAQLEKLRSMKKSSESTPAPGQTVPQFKGKSVHDVLRDEKSSKEDKQAAYETLLKARRGANQNI